MPRDYKSRSRRNRDEPEREGPSAIVWLFVGILIGLIISGIFYLKAQHSVNTTTDKNTPPAKHLISNKHVILPKKSAPVEDQVQAQKPAPVSTENLQTQFDFYNVLPQKTAQIQTTQPTVVSPLPIAQQQPKPTPAPQPVQIQKPVEKPVEKPIEKTIEKPAEKPSNYIIQIAALTKSSDADQLKAQLVLLGFDVNMSPIKKNGQTLQRVWLGPFANKDNATATQKQLSQNQISSLLLKSVT